MIVTLHHGLQTMTAHLTLCLEKTLMGDGERQGLLTISFQTYYDDGICQRGHYSALHLRVPHLIADMCCGRLQIQVTIVPGSITLVPEFQEHTAQGQVTHAMRTLDKILVQQLMGLLFLSVENQLAHLCKMLKGLTAVVVMGGSRPERLLVQLDLFAVGTTIHHGSHVGITDGQRL